VAWRVVRISLVTGSLCGIVEVTVRRQKKLDNFRPEGRESYGSVKSGMC
jgi:hypothetical protein